MTAKAYMQGWKYLVRIRQTLKINRRSRGMSTARIQEFLFMFRTTGIVITVTSLIWKEHRFLRFEIFTVVTMKKAVFWDVAPCRYCVNRRFGGTNRLHLQSLLAPAHAGSSLADFHFLYLAYIRIHMDWYLCARFEASNMERRPRHSSSG
jgi:hypothetical protein